MTDRFQEAQDLVRWVREQLPALKESYAKCLDSKMVSSYLQISIKHDIENLRSALDYCALELHERYCDAANRRDVYFPIAWRGASPLDFPSLVGKRIPGLPKSRPDLVELLSSFQEFSSKGNCWLPDLATLSNENKHQQPTPQSSSETRQRYIQPAANEVTVSQAAFQPAISPGPPCIGGMFSALSTGLAPWSGPLRLEDDVLVPEQNAPAPGVYLDSKQAAPAVEVAWVSFEFSAVGQPVFPFLGTATDGVENIVLTLKAKV